MNRLNSLPYILNIRKFPKRITGNTCSFKPHVACVFETPWLNTIEHVRWVFLLLKVLLPLVYLFSISVDTPNRNLWFVNVLYNALCMAVADTAGIWYKSSFVNLNRQIAKTLFYLCMRSKTTSMWLYWYMAKLSTVIANSIVAHASLF